MDNKLTKKDIRNLAVAYLGLIFFTWNFIWNYNVYGNVVNYNLKEFILSLGGIL